MAMTAFQHYQQSGDPQDLQNASPAVQRANQMIPDGINMKIDIDPKTHQIVLTSTDAEGKAEQEIIDPQMIPGLLSKAMDGSAYWSAMYQVGQPRMAEQKLQNEAGAGKKDNEHEWQLWFGEQMWRQRERQEQLSTEERAAQLEIWKHERDSGEGRSETERQSNADNAFFVQWGDELYKAKEAKDDEQQRQLTAQGVGYRWEHSKPRQNPILDEDLTRVTEREDSPIAKEDRGFVTNLARSIAQKNPAYDAVAAGKLAEAFVTSPNAVEVTPQGLMSVDGNQLIFNPLLLPQLGAMRKKYKPQPAAAQ
jgi:hypothetical protein